MSEHAALLQDMLAYLEEQCMCSEHEAAARKAAELHARIAEELRKAGRL